MCFGHTHKPYHRKFVLADESAKDQFIHAINIGSVGKPKDGDVRACYCIVTINESTSLSDPSSIGVEFIRVEYDVEKAAKAVEESILPKAYAKMLREAH
jgi:diadenosine tetraphosphatase ApaH/serine/threonine PP2A family protein phosphatase